ncbi:hypothetical protein B0A52_04267 [Exophiala mesophila]|uniref:Uncharacterized protein n=1 Tax=Exophiala mesophila TaxID=212818 RepID=A0A438N7W8_EXOME|nr:hypothetical protein B0A52_04267 [Exophiala mesophila]
MCWDRKLLEHAQGRTALLTGSARGIGAETASLLNKHGCNVIITDLPSTVSHAQELILSMRFPERAIFVPASVTDWEQLLNSFKQGIRAFGRIDIVVANAGIMESRAVLEVETDVSGEPIASREGFSVLDVNLKGTLNTLQLGFHFLRQNSLSEHDSHCGSIVLITSTSGYFGFSGNAAYVASKHGILGLFRASQPLAEKTRIRVNAIAPSFTPTRITAGFGDRFEKAGVASNTTEQAAEAIAFAALDPSCSGQVLSNWLGQDLLDALSGFRAIVENMGGYPLPPAASQT